MNTRQIIFKAMENGKEYFRIGKDGRIITMTKEEFFQWQADEYMSYIEKHDAIPMEEFLFINGVNYGRLDRLMDTFNVVKENWFELYDTVVVQMWNKDVNRHLCVGDPDKIRELVRDGARDIEKEMEDCRPEGKKKYYCRDLKSGKISNIVYSDKENIFSFSPYSGHVYMNVKSENDCLYDVQGGNKISRYEYPDNMTAYWFNQNKNGLYLKLESPETIGVIEFK